MYTRFAAGNTAVDRQSRRGASENRYQFSHVKPVVRGDSYLQSSPQQQRSSVDRRGNQDVLSSPISSPYKAAYQMRQKEVIVPTDTVEIIKDRLYWTSSKQPPSNKGEAYYFCIDQVSNLLVRQMHCNMSHSSLTSDRIISQARTSLLSNCSDIWRTRSTKRSRSTILQAPTLIYAPMQRISWVIILGRSADEAWRAFSKVSIPFKPYRDASYGECTYRCSILDCLRGLEYALKLKWFNIKDFNLVQYEYFERVENGDLNEVLPGKFIAFSGPFPTNKSPEGYRTFTPENYVPIFKDLGVTLVIRLNTKSYEASRFTNNGIKHLDLFFPDGSCPPDSIVKEFLEVCEKEKGKIAVHCKAGLGRTGTLIAMYAMKHYQFPAADFIGWIRIVRPGSILGPQQFYLNQKQPEMLKAGSNSLIWKTVRHLVDDIGDLNSRFNNLNVENKGEISPEQLNIAVHGEKNQGEGLVYSKYKMRK